MGTIALICIFGALLTIPIGMLIDLCGSIFALSIIGIVLFTLFVITIVVWMR